jgi:hypothetical protein
LGTFPGLVYVAGDGRSGSSLLDMALGTHPDVSGLGEVHRLSLSPRSRLCSCGIELDSCPYWAAIRSGVEESLSGDLKTWADFPVTPGESAFRSRIGTTLTRIIYTIGWQWLLDASEGHLPSLAQQQVAARNSWILFQAVAAHDGSDFVVDSTKTAGRLKSLVVTAPNPRHVLVVYLIRDGRAVVASELRRTTVSPEEAARRWVRTHRRTAAALHSIPSSQVLRIRYEDFCANPTGTLNVIFDRLGLENIESLHLPPVQENHQVPGNPLLLSGFGPIRIDQRWRQQLTSEQLQAFDRIAGSLNARFGYSRAK